MKWFWVTKVTAAAVQVSKLNLWKLEKDADSYADMLPCFDPLNFPRKVWTIQGKLKIFKENMFQLSWHIHLVALSYSLLFFNKTFERAISSSFPACTSMKYNPSGKCSAIVMVCTNDLGRQKKGLQPRQQSEKEIAQSAGGGKSLGSISERPLINFP